MADLSIGLDLLLALFALTYILRSFTRADRDGASGAFNGSGLGGYGLGLSSDSLGAGSLGTGSLGAGQLIKRSLLNQHVCKRSA